MRRPEAACSGRKDRQRAMPAALAALHHQVERFVPGGGSRTGWHELAAQRPCGGPYACGAQPGVVTVPPAVVWPACRPGASRWPGRAGRSARSPLRDALVALPGYVPIPRAGQNTPRVNGLIAFSADGRTLTLSFTGSACDAAWGACRYESNGTVVAGSWEKPSAGNTPCPGHGHAPHRPRDARPPARHPGDPGRRVRPAAGQRIPDTLTGRAVKVHRADTGR